MPNNKSSQGCQECKTLCTLSCWVVFSSSCHRIVLFGLICNEIPVRIVAGEYFGWGKQFLIVQPPFWLCQLYGLCWVTDRVTDRHLNFISTATRYSTMWSINGIKKSARKKIFPVVQPPYFLSSLLGTVDFSFGRNFGRCGRTFSFYSPFEFVSYPICHWFRPFARSRVSFNSKVPICYGAHTESARDREWVRMTERERMLGMRCSREWAKKETDDWQLIRETIFRL